VWCALRVTDRAQRRCCAKLRLMNGLYEDDLRESALPRVRGCSSTDQELQAEAVTLFLTDTIVGVLQRPSERRKK
jgi:hypothetical protein